MNYLFVAGTFLTKAADDVLLEIVVTTFPAATERVLIAVLDELTKLDVAGIDTDLFARAKLAAAKRMLYTLDNSRRTFGTLQEMALMGDPPADPVAALLAVNRSRCNELLRECLVIERPVISACGPLLEEESESLLAAIRGIE